MIVSFADSGTRDVFDGVDSRQARACCPSTLWTVARRKLDLLHHAVRVQDLAAPPANRLERMAGDRFGQHSIRINAQYRICFRWNAPDAHDVEITDYH